MDETMELIQSAHAGDKEARDRLVADNMGLIWCVVRRFLGRGHEPEDLFQIGSIGLLKAIDKFDTSYDVRFSTYAVPMITGEIKRFLRDDGMIKISRSLKEMAARAGAEEEKKKPVPDIDPRTGKEYETNTVKHHPTKPDMLLVYDQEEHMWVEQAERAFTNFQIRKRAMLGKDYEPPVYLD